MFEGSSQKGLFTFYWEQGQDRKEPSLKERESARDNIKKRQPKMEENDCSQSGKISTDLLHSSLDEFTETKRGGVPRCGMLQQPAECQLIMQRRRTHQEDSPRALAVANIGLALPLITKKQSLDYFSGSRKSSILKKLLCRQLNQECHRLNLQLNAGEKENENKALHSNRIKKKKTSKKRKSGQKTEAKQQLMPTIALVQVSSTTHLPNLGLRPPKKAKTNPIKDAYVIEKVMMERTETMGCSSVVNLGRSNREQYQIRWKFRKQEFLKLLSPSHSQPASKR